MMGLPCPSYCTCEKCRDKKLIEQLEKQIEELKAEVRRLNSRDCSASIELCFDNGTNPFQRETLKIVDVGVSDNVYVVNSVTVEQLQAENQRLMDAIEKIRNNGLITSDLIDLLESRVARVIHLAMKPHNLTVDDWDDSAILGKDNAYRNRVNMAAKLAVIECTKRI